MGSADTNRHKYIVGLDFGTTFTGKVSAPRTDKAADLRLPGISHVASTKNSIKDIEVIRNWPGLDECWKTPSKIAYEVKAEPTENNVISDRQPQWGHQVRCDVNSYSWMKLRLDQHTRLTKFDDISLASLPGSREGLLALPPGKDAVELCADYLRCVYDFTFSELERRMSEQVLKITPMEFWVTHPATWSDQAKQATLEAAKRAGFGTRPGDTIHLITEPEAAAVAALSELVEYGVGDPIRTGDGGK